MLFLFNMIIELIELIHKLGILLIFFESFFRLLEVVFFLCLGVKFSRHENHLNCRLMFGKKFIVVESLTLMKLLFSFGAFFGACLIILVKNLFEVFQCF